MQIPILKGVYASAGELRTALPKNLIPIIKDTGLSGGFLRPADGVINCTADGPGFDRGGINWNGLLYRVMGTKLCLVPEQTDITLPSPQILGDVGEGGQISIDYSFDRLAIASGGRLYYWNGSALTQVTDPDLGTVKDMVWMDGYFVFTDGEFIGVTELNDPTAVNPLKYGSSEADPDPVLAVDKLRGELYAFNRHTIEVFQNVGGANFPFARVPGAQVPRGILGTHTYCQSNNTWFFLGSARNEAPGVYVMTSGDSQRVSTREVDLVLKQFTEAQLSTVLMEARVEDGYEHVLLHLPDRTFVYDVAASRAAQEPVWFILSSGWGGINQYRARNLVRVYNRWIVGDVQGDTNGYRLGQLLPDNAGGHFTSPCDFEFSTMILYNEGREATVHDMELVTVTPARADVWTSYSEDGLTFSQERLCSSNFNVNPRKRIAWRRCGKIRHWRIQKFRMIIQEMLSIARLEANIGP